MNQDRITLDPVVIEDTLKVLRAAIDTIEAALYRLRQDQPKKRRGRKFLTTEERREVSVRMRRHWEAKRLAKVIIQDAIQKEDCDTAQ